MTRVVVLLAVVVSSGAVAVGQQPAKGKPFAWRTGEEKKALLEKYGGTADSEKAVANGLKWLTKTQAKDGGWTFDGQNKTDRAAATGLALLALLGGDPQGADKDQNTKAVKAGIKFLAAVQKADGSFAGADTLYSHGIAAVALCEGFGITGDGKRAAQAAVTYTEAAQAKDGSWGYKTGTTGDTSIGGWQFQALAAARVAGLKTDAKVLKKASEFLASVSSAKGSKYGYNNAASVSPTRTAIGLYSRTVTEEWTAAEPAVKDGLAYVLKNAPAVAAVTDPYALLYFTGVRRMSEDGGWTEWNETVRDTLVRSQVSDDKEKAGSWDPAKDDPYIRQYCGRLGTTAVYVLTLQNYYRYPPPAAKK